MNDNAIFAEVLSICHWVEQSKSGFESELKSYENCFEVLSILNLNFFPKIQNNKTQIKQNVRSIQSVFRDRESSLNQAHV